MSVSAHRDRLASALSTLFSGRVFDTVPDGVVTPCAIVVPTGITYDEAFANGLHTYNYSILVVVGRSDERTAQDRLDGYCDPTGSGSVRAALKADPTLSSAVFDLRVTEMRNYRSLEVDQVTYLSAEFIVAVIAA